MIIRLTRSVCIKGEGFPEGAEMMVPDEIADSLILINKAISLEPPKKKKVADAHVEEPDQSDDPELQNPEEDTDQSDDPELQNPEEDTDQSDDPELQNPEEDTDQSDDPELQNPEEDTGIESVEENVIDPEPHNSEEEKPPTSSAIMDSGKAW